MADEDHELTFEETLKGQIEELKKQIDDQELTPSANIKEDTKQEVMPGEPGPVMAPQLIGTPPRQIAFGRASVDSQCS